MVYLGYMSRIYLSGNKSDKNDHIVTKILMKFRHTRLTIVYISAGFLFVCSCIVYVLTCLLTSCLMIFCGICRKDCRIVCRDVMWFVRILNRHRTSCLLYSSRNQHYEYDLLRQQLLLLLTVTIIVTIIVTLLLKE